MQPTRWLQSPKMVADGLRDSRVVQHGQELPLIELPSGLITFAGATVDFAFWSAKLGVIQAVSASIVQTSPERKVLVVFPDLRADCFENIPDLYAVEVLCMITHNHIVWIACQGGLNVAGKLVDELCSASFHHDKNVVSAREITTRKRSVSVLQATST